MLLTSGRHVAAFEVLRRALTLALAFALAAIVASPTQAQLVGWQKRAWGQAEGAPGMVLSMARTPDGYLWLGSITGLYRFDGQRFLRVPRAPGPAQSDAIGTLVVTKSGELWAGHDWGGVSVLRDGALHAVGQPSAHGSTIRHVLEDPDGGIVAFAVAAGQANIWRLNDGRWQVRPLLAAGWLQAARFDRAGVLWLVADGRLHAVRARGQARLTAAGGFGDEATLAQGPDARLWLVSSDALRRVTLEEGAIKLGAPVSLPPTSGRQEVLFDDLGHFWRISRARGVERFAWNGAGRALLEGWTSDPSVPSPPLPAVGGAAFDRERNLWISAAGGLDQYRPSAFKTWSSPVSPGQQGGAHFVIKDGRGDVFIADRNRLLRVELGAEPKLISSNLVLGDIPCGSASGGVWRRSPGGFERIGGPPGRRVVAGLPTSQFDYVHCVEDAQGSLWFQGGDYDLGYAAGGKARRVDLQVDRGFPVLQLAIDRHGVLAYVGNGYVWRANAGQVAPLWRTARDSVGFVELIHVAGRNVYFGGAGGLTRYDGKTFATASARQWPFLAFLGGMAETRAGMTWFHNADGLVGLPSAELERIFRGERFAPTLRRLGFFDGLIGANPYSNHSSLAEDRWGRIWVATTSAVSVFDPRAAPRNSYVPPVHITAFKVNDRVQPLGPRLRLNAGASRITLAFNALSLADPDHNHFRYRLDGVDSDWVDSGGAREVTYSHLEPGRYQFHVIAANNDGVWNAKGASVEFSIAPAFYQTLWFRTLLVVIAIGFVAVLFRLRLARMAAALRDRESERERERERISRELHDTLVQGVQGLILSVDAAARSIGPTAPGQAQLQGALGLAEQVMTEARERVRTLRLPEGPQDLEMLLNRQVAVANPPPTISISLSDQDWRQPVTPLVAAELAAITGEAVTNIVRHADANAVWIILARRADDLALTIADDGVGFPPEVVAEQRRAGRFGIVGMAERAARIGARLSLHNRPGGGGVVEITVPAPTATGVYGPRPWWRRVRQQLSGKELA